MTKPLLWFELAVLFVSLPALVYFDLSIVPPVVLLYGVAAYALYVCRGQLKAWDSLKYIDWQRDRLEIFWFARRFLIIGAMILAYVAIYHYDEMFSLLRNEPWLIIIIAILYPFLSVLPQEFIYRTFFFKRYEPIFPSPYVMMTASTVLFAYLHIVYRNPIAVLMTLGGGYLFSHTYYKTRSLSLVSIEHYFYGLWIFVVGLGSYFYMGLFDGS